jgi:hypothetical protein
MCFYFFQHVIKNQYINCVESSMKLCFYYLTCFVLKARFSTSVIIGVFIFCFYVLIHRNGLVQGLWLMKLALYDLRNTIENIISSLINSTSTLCI